MWQPEPFIILPSSCPLKKIVGKKWIDILSLKDSMSAKLYRLCVIPGTLYFDTQQESMES